MSGIKIGDLPELSTIPEDNDYLVVVDTNVDVTKKISINNLSDTSIMNHTADYTGSVQRSVSTKLDEAVSVKDFGVVGDGVANDTSAIQSAINSGVRTLYFPEGTYNVDSDIKVTSTIKIYGEGTINETSLREKTFHITADRVSVDGLSFTGPETYSTWINDSVGGRSFQFKSFLWFEGCDDGEIRNIHASGKRGTISVVEGNNFHISNVKHDGFFVDISADSNIPESNFYSHVRLIGGGYHQLDNLWANNVGSVLLVGSSSSYIVAQNVSGKNIHDNGIYNSSGSNNTYNGGTFDIVDGSGVKARGNGNIVSNFTVSDANVGVTISGQFDSTNVDSFGANGYGGVIQGNTVRRHKQVGILVGQAYERTMRDVIVNGNIVDSSAAPRAGSYTGIRVRAIRGANISNNIIRGYNTSHGMFVWGDSAIGEPQTDAIISNNIFANGEDGLRTQYLKRSLITNNQGTSLSSQFIEGIGMDDCYITNNFAPDDAIYFNPGFLCTGNTVTNNVVSSVIADDNLNTIVSAATSYQTGAWTPEFGSTSGSFGTINYILQDGYYVRHGRTVELFARISTSSVDLGTASGALTITGLPYTSADFTSSYSVLGISRVFNWDSDHPTHGWVRRNADYIDLETKRISNGPTINLTPASLKLDSGNEMMISGTYLISTD